MKKICIILTTHFLLLNLIQAQQPMDSLAYHIGLKIEASLYEADATYLTELIDGDSLAGRFIIENENEKLQSLNEEFKSSVHQSFVKKMIELIQRGSYYSFINYYSDDAGDYYLIFRSFGDDGINYHEYYLKFDEKQNPAIHDVYIYLTGEFFSQTLARFYYPMAVQVMKESEASTEIKETVSAYEKLSRISNLLGEGKTLQAWLVYNSIPEKFKTRKSFLLVELRIVNTGETDKKYLEVLNKYNNLYPNDVSYYLLGIDIFLLQENYAKSIEMIDSLEAITGDDFLNLFRGNIYFQAADYESAKKYFEILTDLYPNFEDGKTSLLLTYCKLGEFEQVVRVLELLESEYGYTRAELAAYLESEHQEKIKDKLYRNWKKSKN